ncbi:VWA domain-containing protein [Chloroflexales bacterium ZM16-3]|nr:VWA domain-containing protein [Chloroflexales bacterium ZM16-3]
MTLSFISPAALWALLLLPLIWLLAWLTRAVNIGRIGRARYIALLALRTLMLASLVLALAGAQVVRAVSDTAVVFLIDGSDSLAPALRERALAYVNEAVAAAGPRDQAAVVVFGGSAAVERAPAPPAPLRRLSSAVIGSRTNIADAIQLGMALLPADAQKRLVLISDGGENTGHAAEAARLAALRGIPIEVVPLTGLSGDDVLISALVAPANAREGQDLPVRVRVQSSVEGPARIEIFTDGQLIASQDVRLPVGPSEFSLSLPAGQAGFRRIEARIEAPADTQPLNNRAAAFTQVEGPPRILLVASAADRAAPLQGALAAAGLRVEIVPPAQIPADPARLRDYAAVILIDLPASTMPSAAQAALVSYVRNQGGGLAMVGGTESFGAGGWRRTPIADALPVDLDPPAKQDRPGLGLALVIDRSGSMGEPVDGARTKLDLAKDAVYQATLGLAQSDQIGVFVFDDLAQAVLPIQPLPNLLAIEDALAGVSEGGGTDIRSGIDLAARAISQTDARIKHVILLTDGQASDNYADLIDQMRAEGVTITIVAIGSDANPNLEAIASLGGGAFYNVGSAAEVPQIFLSETVRVAQRDIVEEPFTPAVALPAPPVRDLGGMPTLYGYNATAPRDAARTLLVTPDGSAPILAVWQYGLGRSLAWTSDMKGQWGRDLIAWQGFPRLAAGMIDALLPPPTSDMLSLEARNDGPQAILDLTVSDASGLPLAASSIEGRLLDPNGASSPLSFREVGPGRYRAVTPADQPGAYLAQVVAVDAGGQPLGSASGGLVVSYSPEYGPRSASPSLLADLATLTGGRSDPPPDSLFEPVGQRVGQVSEIAMPLLWLALCLLPLDIALRRLFLRRDAFALPVRRRPAPASPAEDATMARLQAARARARRPTASTPPPASPPPSEELPAPAPAPAPPSAPAEPPAPAEDSISSLLAAKRRRRE